MRLSNPFAGPPPRKAPKIKRDTSEERAEKNYVRARDRDCVARYVVDANPDIVPKGVVTHGPYLERVEGPAT